MKLFNISFLIFILLIASKFSFSQTRALDSLKKVYYSNFDSITAKSYLDYALNSIEREKDDFSNEITFNTDLLKPVSLTKIIKGKNVVYYLSLQTKGSTINYNIKGVYLLFTDGKKWVKLNEAIDLNYSDGYTYSAFIRITPSELKLFQTKKIDKFKLYIYDEKFSSSDSDNFILQSNFIENLK